MFGKKKIGTKKSFFTILQMLTVMVLAIIIKPLKCRLLPTSNFLFQCLSSHFLVTRYFQFRIIFEIHLLGLGGGSTSFIYSKKKEKKKKRFAIFLQNNSASVRMVPTHSPHIFKCQVHLEEWRKIQIQILDIFQTRRRKVLFLPFQNVAHSKFVEKSIFWLC